MKEKFFEGPIEVRRARASDAPMIYELVEKNRKRLAEVFPWVLLIQTISDQTKFYKQTHRLWKAQKGFHYVILHEQKHVGALSVHSINWQEKEAQFGYWLDQDSEGRGFMAKSIRLVEKELQTLGITRLVIRTHDFNERSKKVAESLGYRFDPSVQSQDKALTFVREIKS